MLKKASPELRPVDMNAVIGEVLALVRSELIRDGVAAKTKLTTGLPAVLGDRVQLQQVVLNLIMNAIAAMSTISDRPRTLLIKSAIDTERVLIQFKILEKDSIQSTVTVGLSHFLPPSPRVLE